MSFKTYFGITVHEHGIKVEDIDMIPYDKNWDKDSEEINGVQYLDQTIWEIYATQYIHAHNITFPQGKYTATYIFAEEIPLSDKEHPNIIINSKEILEETRHILRQDTDIEKGLSCLSQ